AFVWMNVFFLGPGFGGGQVAQNGAAALWFLVGLKILHVGVQALRSLADSAFRARTAYAVTTTRVMIMTSVPFRGIRHLDLSAIAEMAVPDGGQKGGGKFLTASDVATQTDQATVGRPFRTPHDSLQFDLEKDAQLVYRLIRRARRPIEATIRN